MKALKGLLIYVGIVLAMILGIGIILFAVMYFVPTFRIMGVGVVHRSGVYDESSLKLSDYSGYSDIELNLSSKRVNIKLNSEKETTDIKYNLNLNTFGIAYDIVEYKVVKQVSVVDNVLKINLNVSEPEGLISDTNSVINITVPSELSYNLVLKTTDGNINLSASEENSLKLNNLTVSTGIGSLRVNNIGETINEENYLILDSLNLSTVSGKMDLSSITNLTINNPVKLYSSSGDFKFNKVIGSFNVAGAGVKLEADTITTDVDGFKFISDNGLFKISKLITPAGAENTIVAENCDIKIDELTGRTAIITTFGNINLGTINSSTILESEHGAVNIGTAKDDIRVQTDFGNIVVNSYLKNAKFVSRKGDINVKSTGDYIQGVYTQIENVDGKIVVDNKINRLLINTTGKSKVEVTYREIKGGLDNPDDVFQHKVNLGSYSSAIVYMPTANFKTPFKFKAKGNISGEISGLTSEYEGDEVKSSDAYQYFPSASAQSQAECQKSCYFEFLGTIEFRGYINR